MQLMSGENPSNDPRSAEFQRKWEDAFENKTGPLAVRAHLVVTAMACFTMLPFGGGCQSKNEEKLLDSAETLLRDSIKQGPKNFAPENIWIRHYSIPGEERGLKAVEKARRGELRTPAMRNSYLTVQANARSGKLGVYFVHRPGALDLDGVYFLTPDGKSHDYHVIRMDSGSPHPQWLPTTWLHGLHFLVVIDDHTVSKQEQEFVDSTSTRPIHAEKRFFEPGNLRVGLITQDGQRSDVVPVYVEFQNKVDAERPWGHKKQQKNGVTSSIAK